MNESYLNIKTWMKPHNLVLVLTWFITSTLTVYLLIIGMLNNDEYQGLRYVMHTAYVLSLIWFLTKLELPAVQHPDIKPFIFPRWKYGKIIPVIFVFILLLLNVLTDQVDSIIFLILVFT
ncbi:MAG: hypothetical protein JXB49_12880, partial [Bacteroidales bacterium]|nr:hypothetical protein [Bacteroidales bacterium]